MRTTVAVLVGVTAGVAGTVFTRRYAGAFLQWLFSRGDTP
jgi:hypothetical protein